MPAVAPYTTASAFLEHVSTAEGVSYTVPTSAPVDETAPVPLLDQQDHALYSSTYFPPADTNGFVLARVIEDAYTLELRWCAFSRPGEGAIELARRDGAGVENAFAELDSHPGTLPPVSFVFPSRLVPSPAFSVLDSTADRGRQLQIFCVTEAGYLYTLTFPLLSLFYASDVLAEGGWSVESRVESLDGRRPVLLHGVDQDRVLVATAEGQLIGAEMTAGDEGRLIESELRSPSSFSMRSLLPSFSTRNLASPTKGSSQPIGSPSQLLSLATITSDLPKDSFTLGFGVSRDRKLRIWRLETGACLRVIDLPQYEASRSGALALAGASHLDSPRSASAHNSALLAPTAQTLVKLVEGSETTPFRSYLALFSPATGSAPSAFFLYGMATDPTTGELKELEPVVTRACPFTSASSLVDFDVVRMDVSGQARWTLWACWDNGGEMEVRSADVSELDGLVAEEGGEEWSVIDVPASSRTSTWTAAYFDEQLRDAQESVAEVFLRHIARPGRYPPSTLDFALAEYQNLVTAEVADAGAFLPEQFDLDYPSQIARAAAIVGSTVVLQQDAETGAILRDEFNHQLKLEWLRFVALLNESRAAALYPTCLAVDEKRGIASIIGRDSFSVPVVREAVHVLHDDSAAQQLLSAPETVIDLPPAVATDLALRADILPLLVLIRSLQSSVSAGTQRSLAAALLAQLSKPTLEDIGASALDLYESHLARAVDPALPQVVAGIVALENAERAVEVFLRLLTTEQLPPIAIGDDEGQEATNLANALLLDLFALSIEARYELVQGLVILLLATRAADDQPEEDAASQIDRPAELVEGLDRVTAAAFTAFHALATQQWLVESIATPSLDALRMFMSRRAAEDQDGVVQKLGNLRMQEGSASGESLPVPLQGLLDAVLRLPDFSASLLPASRSAMSVSLAYATSGLFRSLAILPPSSQSEVTTSQAPAVLAMRMCELALYREALEWASFWPASAGLCYPTGCAHLELGDEAAACDALGRAAAALLPGAQDFSPLAAVLPPNVPRTPAHYYVHISDLASVTPFDGVVATFAERALDAADAEELDEPKLINDLWMKLFRSHAAAGDYIKAYQAVLAIPDSETRMTCLAHFISVVCENGAASLLSTFSFAGLEADLERNLAFRARNSDPLAQPNYYRILYAYHTAKGDYRSAGTVMYQEGCRLGEVASHPGASYRQLATRQCQSYLAAVNALTLVPREQAWVAVASGDYGDRNAKRRKVAYRIPEAEFDPSQVSGPLDVLELPDIRREYSLALARLELSVDFPELERANFHLEPETVVALFTQLGRFDRAFAAGTAFDSDLLSLFEAVAARCLALSSQGEGSQDLSWIMMAEEASTWNGSAASKAWRLLERYLERHDTDATVRYRRAVLDFVLVNNRGTKSPSFLLQQLASKDLPSLLRILIKHDRLGDAFDLAIKDCSVPIAATAPFSLCEPFQAYDQLLAIPPGDCRSLSDDVLKQKQDDLRQALAGRRSSVEKIEKGFRRR